MKEEREEWMGLLRWEMMNVKKDRGREMGRKETEQEKGSKKGM